MVGQAYSLDFNLGYEYIVIRAYDCDDLSFVDSLSPYQLYRVRRDNLKVERVLPKSGKTGKRLSLKHITAIKEMIEYWEDANSYPVAISWEITPSGECVCKNTEDIHGAWPVPSWLTAKETAYINITDMCFDSSPGYLDVSFLCEVLNESLYLCGIYNSDMFAVCGNEIFCSLDFASLERKLFSSDTVYSRFSAYGTYRLPKCEASIQTVISHICRLEFNHGDYTHGSAEAIVNIKRECIEQICTLISDCLKKCHSFRWLSEHIRLCVARSALKLKDYGTELISITSSSRSTDVNYLFYNELLEAFAFADSMRDISKTIRKNRFRKSKLKGIERPMLIYKGRLYKEKRGSENENCRRIYFKGNCR